MTLFAEKAPVHPPIKWAGGKRWLVPQLEAQLPVYDRLVEPCMGALSVTLGLAPKRALVNDINPHLVNFYRQIQGGLKLEIDFRNSEDDYYLARKRFNDVILSGDYMTSEMAQLFYYLNRTGFNGLCRFNSSGMFNVPYGKYSRINYRDNFEDIQVSLEGFRITEGSFTDIPYLDGDFIYVDPPYDTPFTSYSKGGFTWDDQVSLANFFVNLGLPVIISNQATPRILELYNDLGFTIDRIRAPRRISSNGNREDALEILARRF